MQDIDYVNAHGTSTLLGDSAETKALKLALDGHAFNVPVSSTKSMIGHLIGASGSVETIATALMIDEGIIHPTINLETQDYEGGCDLHYVPNRPVKKDIGVALKNSFGFGGYNSVLALRKWY